jgi:dihydroorotate dehydrogenase
VYSILKKILFQLAPETAHHVTLNLLRYAYQLRLTQLFSPATLNQSVKVMGLNFPNRVGLAAGLDKNGDYIEPLSALGFGFVEIGTVTPKPQPGNPKPRLFRLLPEEAIINRMGFNNHGLDHMEAVLQKSHFKGILGINIGKNKDTSLENAVDDYLMGFQRMAPYASYITINISSPNTQGLRDLQQGEKLQNLLANLKNAQAKLKKYIPLVVKVAPDLSSEEINDIAKILLTEKIDGLIATNTTLDRTAVQDSFYAKEAGGLSGKPLMTRSTQMVKEFSTILRDDIPIIACGGIFDADDAKEKYAAGASLVQIYTGLIYRGPKLIHDIINIHADTKL